MPGDRFCCRNCEYSTSYFNRYLIHTWDKHSFSNGFSYCCNISSCPKLYTSLKCFRRHVKSCHPWFYENYMQVRKENVSDANDVFDGPGDSGDDFIQMNDLNSEEEQLSESLFDYNVEVDIVAILLELREKHFVANQALTFLCEKFKTLIDCDRKRYAESILNSLLRNHESFVLDYETRMCIKSESECSLALEKFSRKNALSDFVCSQKNYIEPIEIKLVTDEKGNHETYQYIPIHRTLGALLCHEDVLSYFLTERNSNGQYLKEYADGTAFGENKLFSSTPNSIQVILYHDDFKEVNPLGNKTVKFKISAFYFVLGNLPAKYRSRLDDINLVLLCLSCYVTKYGYDILLKNFIEDLKSLEIGGVQIEFQGIEYRFLGTISMVIADNLICRFCNFSRKRDEPTISTSLLTLRTKEGYDNNIEAIEQDGSLSPIYGLKSKSVLSELKYFHVISGFPPDIAHDCFEGFAVDLVTNILVHFVKEGLFTLETFSSLIEKFSYSQIDKRNKPQPINIKNKPLDKIRVKQTACEMWNLLRLLPFLIGDLIPRNNEHWAVFVEFLDIHERMCAPHFTKSDLNYLEQLTDEFFVNYVKLFPDEKLKPKSHFLKHYSLNMLKFGPLVKTLRFEAKHSYFKSVLQLSKNRVNVCKSVAQHHQCLMYLHYNKENILDFKVPKGIFTKEVPIEALESGNFKLTLIKDLYDFHPLAVYTNKNGTFIPLRHYVPVDI